MQLKNAALIGVGSNVAGQLAEKYWPSALAMVPSNLRGPLGATVGAVLVGMVGGPNSSWKRAAIYGGGGYFLGDLAGDTLSQFTSSIPSFGGIDFGKAAVHVGAVVGLNYAWK